MPRSRNRKKKPKKKKKITPKKEVIRVNGIEIIRKGKNIFYTNKRTEEEHTAFIKQLKEDRPKVYEEIKKLIDETVSLINAYDKILIVGGIASFGYNKMLTDESDDGLSETTIEYCQSIATATPNINKGKVPTGETLFKIYESLVEIRRLFNIYFSAENVTGKYSELESHFRYDMITETLWVRGQGYMIHIRELFLEMFSLHDDFLKENYGFTSKDLIDTFDKLEESYGCRLLMPNGKPHPVQTLKLSKWMRKNQNKISPEMIHSGEYLNEFVKEHPEIIVENNGVILYPLNNIDTYDGLYKIRHFNEIQEKVVKALSIKFGENAVFTKPKKFEYEILNKSEIYNYPIIEDENENHYLFSMNLAARNYFLIAQSLIQRANPQYYNNSFLGNRIVKAKDEFIERKVLTLFEKMLPKTTFYKGVYYKFTNPLLDLKCTKATDGRYELDLLGISEHATYLIEVKAGLISEEAKRGAISSIKTDLTSVIGDAICQSYRAYQFITETQKPIFESSEGKNLLPLNTTNVFRISISFSYVGSLIASLSKLKQFGIIDNNSEFAWTINIFDLMACSELMTSEEMFIDYLSKRLPLYEDERLTNIDEMDMLGLYFNNDLKIDKAFKEAHTIQLNQYKKDIDNYFEKNGKKPRKKKARAANTQ